MQVNQCSQTSIVTAFARAYHARHDQPVIFDDVSGGELLTGVLLHFNALEMRFMRMVVERDPQCPCCSGGGNFPLAALISCLSLR